MKTFTLTALLFLCHAASTIKAQSWTAIGCNEQTSTSVTKTFAFTFYMQVSQDGAPHISFIDDASGPNNIGDFKIHVRKYNGTQWTDMGGGATLTFPANDFFPIAFDNNTMHMAYSYPFGTLSAGKLTVRRLNTSTQWENAGSAAFSEDAANGTAITAANGKVYVAYADESVSGKITVKMLDNANTPAGWQTIGPRGFSAGAITQFPGSGAAITVDNNIPYVAYSDISLNAGEMVVKKWDGTAWVNVGTNSPSFNHFASSDRLKFDANHTPYIAFNDLVDIKGYVRKLNAANQWETVGPPVSATVATNIALVVVNNNIFTAYSIINAGNITQAFVKRYNSTTGTWADAGTQPVTGATINISNLELETDGQNKLYIAYRSNLDGGIYAKSFDASGILPVTLKTFTVKAQNSNSLLQWATATETNNKAFVIEHSSNGIDFTPIGQVAGKGSSATEQQYSFVHTLPLYGLNYYRLKQVDNNGSFSYSATIAIEHQVHTGSSINIFPNPVSDVLHVQHTLHDAKEVIIKNAAGKIVKRIKATDRSVDIPVKDLGAGTYFITLHGASASETKTFIK